MNFLLFSQSKDLCKDIAHAGSTWGSKVLENSSERLMGW